nr:Fanconi anemia group J protein homolog [Lytechinus pictus]
MHVMLGPFSIVNIRSSEPVSTLVPGCSKITDEFTFYKMMEQTYTILGVKLAFPCKAYPTQLSMMSMIIKGINRHQNCLLESPTGSGKSLALLCSSLGWQAGEREKQKKAAAEAYNKADYIPSDEDYNADSFRKPCTCSCNKPTASTTDPGPSTSTASSSIVLRDDEKPSNISPPVESKGKEEENAILISEDEDEKKDDDDDDFDFQPSKKRSRNSVGPMGTAKKTKHQKGVVFDDDFEDVVEQSPNPHTKAHWQMKLVTPQAKAGASELSGSKNDTSPCSCSCHISKCQKMMEEEEKGMKKEGDAPKPIKVPRIYFGTRTHKQIAQIIRELGRTAYKSVRMSILGSREHTCVHPEVSKSKNKNEGCKELLDNKTGGTCKYFTNVHKMKQQWQIRDYGLTEAWDIEDLVNLGRRVKACPYFSSRSLKDQADVIFCPYNYLIDPMIRESMEIDLKGQVVILDEAHNIEDSAREAASLTVTTEQLQDAIDELDKLLSFKFREEHTRVIHSVGSSILRWINDFSTTLRQNDFDRASRMWTGQEMVAALANMGISPGTLGTLQHHLAALTEDEDERGIKEMGPSLGAATGSLFKALFVIFNFLFKDDMKFTKDYKVALLRTKAKNQFPNTNNRWIQRRRSNQAVWTLSLNFWCLNPAVAFTDFGNAVRTIILTSGTLSPMSSFASELGVAFPIQLEANHVIKSSQVWVGSLAFGPNGHSLNATYKNAETFAFQDDLGRVVLEVCKVIPYGVLCFVSSYSMMNKVIERWTATGLYDQLQSLKSVMCEARGGDKSVFDEQLREFYETIKLCEEDGLENQRITGVLMFAVCRGKISEGMDFADNNARAVITVGIPYPNVRDAQVEAKRHYNDQYAASRGLLSGGEWYEVQAYRALNQALGRCIRHKKDWGAILLIDERFSRNPKKYISGISKWVRGKVNHHSQARDALTSLSEFANLRMQTSPDADTSVFDGSQPNSQTLSPVTPSASSLNTSNLSHTPFRFGHQTSMPGTPECGQTNRMDNTSLPKQEKGMLFGRSNVGQLFIPMSKSAPTPTSNSMNDPTPLQHHIGQQGSMGSFVARGNGQCQTVAEEDQEEQTKGRKTRRERKPKGKRAREKLDAAQKVPPQQTLLSFSPAVASNASIVVSKQQLGMSLINKTNGTPNVVIMNSGTCQNAQAESTSFVPVHSVQALPSVPIHSGGVIDLTSPVKSLSNVDEVQRTHIPTPKAKLKFDDEPLPKVRDEATKTSFTSFKNKLSRFAFTKDENDNGCQKEERNDKKCCRFKSSCGNVSNQETLVKGNFEEVQDDHTLKGDQRTTCVPTSDEEEEQCEEDMRRKQREEDNGTPVLFDSEMGDSGSDAPGKPIPFSPQGTKAEPEESKKCTFSTEDISKHNEITNESNNYYAADRTDDTNEMKTERDCDRSSRRLSIKGRRNLSRRKDHGEQNEAKEDVNETTVQDTKPHMLVRRSARTRRTPKKVIDSVEKSKFCKDDIECAQCGIPLVRNLDGVTCLLPEDVKNKYLSDVMATKERGQRSSCRCAVKGVEGSMLMTDASNLVHCNSITAENKSGKR